MVRTRRNLPSSRRRSGFSLLEVILALAILGGAIAVLGEVARMALRNAEYAREVMLAQTFCENKLSEIVSGLASPDPVQNAPIEQTADPTGSTWRYSVETSSLSEDTLLLLRVTVAREASANKTPIQFSLQRWIVNPDSTASPQSKVQSQTEQGNAS
jgi:type II secretion system protein I